MKSFLIRGHLATAAVMAGVALTPSEALGDGGADARAPGHVQASTDAPEPELRVRTGKPGLSQSIRALLGLESRWG